MSESVCKQLDYLKKRELKKVCVETVYNVIGYLMSGKDDKTITKKTFENFLKCNIEHKMTSNAIFGYMLRGKKEQRPSKPDFVPPSQSNFTTCKAPKYPRPKPPGGGSGLRKDDPVYYKNKVADLIKQALNEGLAVSVEVLKNEAVIYFKADNGDTAGVKLINTNS